MAVAAMDMAVVATMDMAAMDPAVAVPVMDLAVAAVMMDTAVDGGSSSGSK